MLQVRGLVFLKKDRLKPWSNNEMQNLDNAAKAMAQSIVNNAKITVPKKSGALESSGRVEGSNGSYGAVFGSSSVPYARYQEFGNWDWNFTTPGTHPDYLLMAGDSIAKRGVTDVVGVVQRGIGIFL